MDIDKKLDSLKKIREVEAPAFLYTRIRARIDTLTEAPAPLVWKWSFALAALLVLVLNTGILLWSAGTSSAAEDVSTLANAMQLSSSNTFYHE